MHKPIDITAGKVVPPVGALWSIRYAYTFGGHKFLKETELAGEEETCLYLGGAEFVNGQPESYYHGEGRVALTDSVPRFQYKLTDHLGNTMVLFEDIDSDGIITTESMSTDPAEVEVLQRNFYYAFGLPMQGPWNHTPTDPAMPYLYNGKELEGELGLGWMDYGARRYDAAIGRWGGVDPLAHLHYGWSSYAYVGNNPILLIDPDGMKWVNPYDGVEGQEVKAKYVNDAIQRIKENDQELYDYIDNLTITVDGKKVDVIVNVLWSGQLKGEGGNSAETRYILPGKKGEYEGKEIEVPVFIASSGEGLTGTGVGFNVILHTSRGISDDGNLANEAGDVMFFMEYNELARDNSSADRQSRDAYDRSLVNDYSNAVENAYKLRRKSSDKVSGVGKMYPLIIKSNQIYSNEGDVLLGRH